MIESLHESDSVLNNRPEDTSTQYLATGFSVFIFATTPLNVAMVVIGLMYKKECPLDERLPRYLLFGGIAGLTIVLVRISLVIAVRNVDWTKRPKAPAGLNMARSTMYLFILFIFIWNLHGSFLLFSSHPELNDKTSSSYCEALVIKFSYIWFTIFDIATITSILIWLISLIMGCMDPDFLIIAGIPPPSFLLKKRHSDTELILQDTTTNFENDKFKKIYIMNQLDLHHNKPYDIEKGKLDKNKTFSTPGRGDTRDDSSKIIRKMPSFSESRRGSCVSTVIITPPQRLNEDETESKKIFTLTAVDDAA
ncbi:uncharacterized protein [Lepeophtheirus salmonis]